MDADTSVGEQPQAVKKKRCTVRWWVWLVVRLIVLGCVIRASLPGVVRWGIASTFEREAGAIIEMGNVDLWLVEGRIALEDVKVWSPENASITHTQQEGMPPILEWQRVTASWDWADLWQRHVRVYELLVESPRIDLQQDDNGSITLLAALGSHNAQADQNPPVGETPASSKPWSLQVHQLTVLDADLTVSNAKEAQKPLLLQLNHLELSDIQVSEDSVGFGRATIRAPLARFDPALIPHGDDITADGHERIHFVGEGGETREDNGAVQEPEPSDPATPVQDHPVVTDEPGFDLAIHEVKIEIDGAKLITTTDESLDWAIAGVLIDVAQAMLTTPDGEVPVSLHLGATEMAPRTDGGFPIKVEMRSGGGSLSLEGKLNLDPVAYHGNVTWTDLPIRSPSPSIHAQLAQWAGSGRSSGDLAISTTAQGQDAGLLVAGQVTISELTIADPTGEEFSLGWQEMALAIREGYLPLPGNQDQTKPGHLALERIRLVGPVLTYTHPPEALQRLIDEFAGDGVVTDEPGSDQPMSLTIDSFELTEGSTTVTDRSVSPFYQGGVNHLQVSVHDVTWPGVGFKEARVAGHSLHDGSFEVTGSLEQGVGELALILDQLELTHLNPYATTYSGYQIERGRVSLNSQVAIHAEKWEVENKLVLHKVHYKKYGDAEPAVKMPGALEMALLRDLEGNITLPVPITVENDQSEIKSQLAPLVLSAFQHALFGAVTSPLKVVGAILTPNQDGPIGIDPFEMVAGSHELVEDQSQRVEGLAQLLATRPGLGVRLIGTVGQHDVPNLATRMLIESVQGGQPLPSLGSVDWFAQQRVIEVLEAWGRGEDARLSQEEQRLLDRYTRATQVPPLRLAELALLRGQTVRDMLLEKRGLDPSRFEVQVNVKVGEEPGGVRVELIAK